MHPRIDEGIIADGYTPFGKPVHLSWLELGVAVRLGDPDPDGPAWWFAHRPPIIEASCRLSPYRIRTARELCARLAAGGANGV